MFTTIMNILILPARGSTLAVKRTSIVIESMNEILYSACIQLEAVQSAEHRE